MGALGAMPLIGYFYCRRDILLFLLGLKTLRFLLVTLDFYLSLHVYYICLHTNIYSLQYKSLCHLKLFFFLLSYTLHISSCLLLLLLCLSFWHPIFVKVQMHFASLFVFFVFLSRSNSLLLLRSTAWQLGWSTFLLWHFCCTPPASVFFFLCFSPLDFRSLGSWSCHPTGLVTHPSRFFLSSSLALLDESISNLGGAASLKMNFYSLLSIVLFLGLFRDFYESIFLVLRKPFCLIWYYWHRICYFFNYIIIMIILKKLKCYLRFFQRD